MSSSGYALETSGKVKIAGNGQSVYYGKVLTTDGVGNATWEGAIAFSANGVSDAHNDLGYAVAKKVVLATKQYDMQNNFTSAANANPSVFTAPVKGIYHFDAQVTTGPIVGVSPNHYISNELRLMTKIDGVTSMITSTTVTASVPSRTTLQISIDCPVTTGDEVWLEIWQNSATGAYIVEGSTLSRFSGRLVLKTAPGLFD